MSGKMGWWRQRRQAAVAAAEVLWAARTLWEVSWHSSNADPTCPDLLVPSIALEGAERVECGA